MDARSRWAQVDATKDPQQVSWFRPHQHETPSGAEQQFLSCWYRFS